MKKLYLMALATGFMLAGNAVQAAHVWEDPSEWSSGVFVYDVKSAKFTANELSMDLFGLYTARERGIEHLFETSIHHGDWGGGVGLNYFITREIGIGVDAAMPANDGAFVDEVLGSLIIRIPFESCGLAPYVFGGGGRGIDPAWEWIGDVGVGLEWRMNPRTGVFADGRYLWLDHTPDKLLLRAGIRLVF